MGRAGDCAATGGSALWGSLDGSIGLLWRSGIGTRVGDAEDQRWPLHQHGAVVAEDRVGSHSELPLLWAVVLRGR